MNRNERVIAEAFAWLGLIMALAAAVIGEVQKPEEKNWLKLLTASVVAMWPAIILFFRAVQKHYDEIAPYITDRVEYTKSFDILKHALQKGTFQEGRIDSGFWLKYGEFILNDKQLVKVMKPAYVLAATKESRVRVPPRISYELMLFLFKKAVEDDHYFAIATQDEMLQATGVAYDFLYEVPLQYPTKVHRILVLQDQTFLGSKLPAQRREALLAQLAANVELKYILSSPDEVPNIGVYGKIAVGDLDADRWNIVDFNKGYVGVEKQKFDTVWNRAKPLSAAHLAPV